MAPQRGSDMIKDWPGESHEAARLVIDTYGNRTRRPSRFCCGTASGPGSG